MRKVLAIVVVLLIVFASIGIIYNLKNDDKKEYVDYEEVHQFLELSKVPRCTFHNEKIGQYLLDFAKEHNLPSEMDEVGNVLIDHPGTVDTKMILQGHMDMVAATDEKTDHDWENDPLDVYIKNGMIRARGTSLGADNGAGMAIMLTALISPNFDDTSFRCIFTVEEEAGFEGAMNLNPDWLKDYKYLLNIDNETEGEVLIGAAGYCSARASYKPTLEPSEGVCFTVTISGLKGGHSALVIKERANAVIYLCKYLDKIDNAKLVRISGGIAGNVIPDRATAEFIVPAGTDVTSAINQIKAEFEKEYVEPGYEDGINITIKPTEVVPRESWTENDTKKLVNAVLTCPNGVFEEYEYGIKSSSNIGKISTIDGTCNIEFMLRSVDYETMELYFEEITGVFENIGCTTEGVSYSDGWYEDRSSPLVQKAIDAYIVLEGTEPAISIVHGALECACFHSKNPELTQISIGPTIHDVHSVNEEMSVESFHATKEYAFQIMEMVVENAS